MESGVFDLGFERAGIETVIQVEQDKHALGVLERHWPNVERITDVRAVGVSVAGGNGRYLTEQSAGSTEHYTSAGVDLIYGGFPCQDVSVAGKRAGLGGERSGLWFEFERIVSELQPRWVVIENVPGLLSSNGGADFGVILTGLDQLGFDASWAILDSQHFGVPQRRRRVFIVGGPRGRGAEQILSICESCGGNPETGQAPGEDVAGTIRSRFDSSPRGDSNDNLIAETYLPSGETDQSGTVTAAKGPGTYGAPEVDAGHLLIGALDTKLGDKMWLENQPVEKYGTMDAAGAGVRRLTPTECERLQGFPDGWTAGQSDSHRYKQMGNAVTVPVAEWIGHRLMAVDRLETRS